jgi:hypothetical protein
MAQEIWLTPYRREGAGGGPSYGVHVAKKSAHLQDVDVEIG